MGRRPVVYGRPGSCRHCGASSAWLRARRLCRRCYDDVSIRDLYTLRWNARREQSAGDIRDFNGEGALPGQPTFHPPGSPEKMEVLAERASRGERLHHDGDLTIATMPDEYLVRLLEVA